MNIQPIREGNYYHIYNRGVNSEDIFKEEKNYFYFLQQYKKYCGDVFETLAYTLLKNHFHLLVYVKENVTVKRNDGKGDICLNASVQLSHFFNSYAQAINKGYDRTGALFESPFERRLIDDDNYFTSMVLYCHYNAQLHGLVNDLRDWPHSSYHDIINDNNNIVSVKNMHEWFGGIDHFKEQHKNKYHGGGLYLDIIHSNQPPAGLTAAAGVYEHESSNRL